MTIRPYSAEIKERVAQYIYPASAFIACSRVKLNLLTIYLFNLEQIVSSWITTEEDWKKQAD
jgi:hypothetical protein